MKKLRTILLAGGFLSVLLFMVPSSAKAQCSGNPNSPGNGYIINQALQDPNAAGFIARGSSQNFWRTVTVDRRNDGYTITIVDTPKCNAGNFNDCYPFSFFALIELDCNFNVIAIAVS